MKGRSFRMMLLALATVFMVAGCGGDNSDKVSNPDGAVAFAIHEQPDGIPGKLLNDVKAKSEGAGSLSMRLLEVMPIFSWIR